MPSVLRKIRGGRWARPRWLPTDDDLPADAMADLVTQGNELSVYLVDDDHGNLEMIVAALAANCDFIANFDYALVELTHLDGLSLTVRKSLGDTPCPEGNQYHRDIYELTGRKLLGIGLAIFRHGTRERLREKQVFSLLIDAINKGWIETSRLEKGLLETLQKRR